MVFDGFVVEREVVEEGPEDHAVDDGAEVGYLGGAALEDGERDHGFGPGVLGFFAVDFGEEGLPYDEGCVAGDAEKERNECSPGGPGVGDSTLVSLALNERWLFASMDSPK